MALLLHVASTGTVHPRGTLAALLWPDLERPRAMANLRVVLSDLRTAVGDALEITRTTVAIADHARDRVDVLRFRDRSDRAVARAQVTAARDLLEQALAAYGGELLTGFEVDVGADFEQWLVTERTHLQLRAIEVAEALVDTDLARGVTSQTLLTARRLVDLDPFREPSQERLMRVQWVLGDRAGALAGFDRWTETFHAELGIPVSTELGELAQRIRRGSAPATPRRARTASRVPRPHQLVGRSAAVDDVASCVAPGALRLVTVTGPAGVGKTSLALAVCDRVRRTHPRPLAYVDLVDVPPGDLESGLTDATVDATLHAGLDPFEGRTLHGLVVLDNFEHLLGDRAFLADLLGRHPALQVLVTSRTPLRLAEETVVPLPPLAIPPPRAEPDVAAEHDAVRLFLERAHAAGTAIVPTSDNLEQVASICRQVDGLPLGIELAAARVRMFGLEGLASALGDDENRWQVDGLPGAAGRDDVRQGTVQSAVSWSATLLSEPARVVLRRLAVFADTFDLPAAVHVAGAGHLGQAEVVDALAELVDFHLVVPERSGGVRSRFRLLVTTRAWATRALQDVGEEPAARERHADHYLAAAQQQQVNGRGGGWRDRAADLSNVAAATRWLARAGSADRARQLLSAVGPAWRYAGRTGLGLQAHAAVTGGRDPVIRAAGAIWHAGLLAEQRGRTAAEAVVELVRQHVGMLDPREHGTTWARCLAEAVRAVSYVGKDLYALELAEQLATDARGPEQRRWELGARWETAWMAHRRGDDRAATKILRDLLADAIALGNHRVELYGWMLAELCGADRDALAVEPRSLHELLELSLAVDDRRYTTWLLVSLGAVATIDRRLDEASEHFLEAFALAGEAGYDAGLGFCLLGVVGIAAFDGDLATACRLHGALVPHLPSLYQVLPRDFRVAYEGVVTMLRDAAGGRDELARAWAQGSGRGLHAAADEAHALLVSTRSREESGPGRRTSPHPDRYL